MKKFIFTVLAIFIFSQCGFCSNEPQDRFSIDENQEMSLSESAMILYGENNTDEAMSYILRIKEMDRTPQDWLILGNILQDEGKLSDAIFMYNRAVMLDKKYYKAYYNLANIYYNENKLNLAVQNYKLASKYSDKFPYSHYNLGCVYLDQGQTQKAKMEFLKAVEIKNTVPEFHYNLAYVYKKLGKDKVAKKYLDNYNQLMLSE